MNAFNPNPRTRPLNTPGTLKVNPYRHPWVVRMHGQFYGMYSSELAAVNTVISLMRDLGVHQVHPILSWAAEEVNQRTGGYDEVCTDTVIANRGLSSWLPSPYSRQSSLEKIQVDLMEREGYKWMSRKSLPQSVPTTTRSKDVVA